MTKRKLPATMPWGSAHYNDRPIIQRPISDTQTDLEMFQLGENIVVFDWRQGESAEISVFTRGTSDPLYVGPSRVTAQLSTGLNDSDWTDLLSTEVQYLT